LETDKEKEKNEDTVEVKDGDNVIHKKRRRKNVESKDAYT
jgi:co-chaperonin GroES (HSP10)